MSTFCCSLAFLHIENTANIKCLEARWVLCLVGEIKFIQILQLPLSFLPSNELSIYTTKHVSLFLFIYLGHCRKQGRLKGGTCKGQERQRFGYEEEG